MRWKQIPRTVDPPIISDELGQGWPRTVSLFYWLSISLPTLPMAYTLARTGKASGCPRQVRLEGKGNPVASILRQGWDILTIHPLA